MDEDTVSLTLTGNRVEFELGGRSGNVVTSSTNPKVGKGWRLLSVDGTSVADTSPANVKAAVDKARRKAKFTATFFGGKLSGGGGMNMEALSKAALATQRLTAASAPSKALASAPAKAPPPPPSPPTPPVAPPPAAAPPAGSTSSELEQPKAPPSKDEVQHAFISFDFDRDGALSFKDCCQMLAKLNEEYDFAEVGTAAFGRLVSSNFSRAGGRRADPEDEDDEEQGVTPSGFVRWYPEFLMQCEQRKSNECVATRSMGDAQFEAWRATRTLEARNRNFPLLRSL